MRQVQIGKYKVIFPINKGDYAETYRVKDESGEKYFLKLVNTAKISKQQVEGSDILLSAKTSRCNFVNSFCRTADAIAASGYNKDTKMANRATK